MAKALVCHTCGRAIGTTGRCYRHFPDHATARQPPGELTERQAYAVSHCYACHTALCLDRAAHPDGAVCHNVSCRTHTPHDTQNDTETTNALETTHEVRGPG